MCPSASSVQKGSLSASGCGSKGPGSSGVDALPVHCIRATPLCGREDEGRTLHHRPGCHQANFSAVDLTRSALTAQLKDRFGDVVEPHQVTLGQQSAVRVDRQSSTDDDGVVLHDVI